MNPSLLPVAHVAKGPGVRKGLQEQCFTRDSVWLCASFPLRLTCLRVLRLVFSAQSWKRCTYLVTFAVVVHAKS